MSQDIRPRLSAVSNALPAALVVWKLGSRLMGQAGHNPMARRWARLGAVAAAVAGLSAILVGIANSLPAGDRSLSLDQRLDESLEESFPASDPPSVTRPGA